MKIIEQSYKWNGTLSKRLLTKHIILHHRAGNGDVQSIHKSHIAANGWVGIGYHFYVRKDGIVYRGRPLETVGAHCKEKNQNYESIGICFEGNFQNEKMSDKQEQAGRELITYLRGIYPNAEVKRHSDFMATACPGRYFPFDEIKEGKVKKELTSADDIIWELSQMIEITEVGKAVKALEKAKEENSSLYWILRKIVNK